MVQSLADSVLVPMNYAHYLALEAIDQHYFVDVRKKVKQEHPTFTNDFLDLGILYLKRYYAIHVLDPLNPPAMSLPLDPFWHSHILYSEDYFAFCNKVFGEYLHHIPLLFEDVVADQFVKSMYEHTYARHEEIFGTVDQTMFPKLDAKINPGETMGRCCSPKAAMRLQGFVDIALFAEDKLLKLMPGKARAFSEPKAEP